MMTGTGDENMILVSRALRDEPDWLGVKFSRPMAWIDLLFLAEEGRVTASFRELSERWKWSVTRVIRFIDELEAKCFVKRFADAFRGRQTKQIIYIVSSCCDTLRNDTDLFHETFRKESPLSPGPSPEVSPAPPSNSLPYPPISPLKDGTAPLCAPVSVCEAPEGVQAQPPTPFPNPFILSSVERDWTRGEPSAVVYVKRTHLARNLAAVAAELGMDAQAQEAFLDYWCAPEVRAPSEIRAEGDRYFDIRARAKAWMRREKDAGTAPASRAEQYADSARNIHRIFDEIYGTSENETGRTGGRVAVAPDEQ